jgi:hypothetical protein
MVTQTFKVFKRSKCIISSPRNQPEDHTIPGKAKPAIVSKRCVKEDFCICG